MKIACVQFSPAYRDTSKNLAHMQELTARADADILVFPELALTGYFFKRKEDIAPLAEPADGSLARAISQIARSEKKAIITGFLELDGKKYFNSALAFDSDGKLAGHYRKVHLYYYEKEIFEPGDLDFPVFQLATRSGIANVGMLICYDWRFPEAARKLALGGAELIVMPSNIVTTTGMLHTTMRTRAFENKVVLAFADRIGMEHYGDESLTFRGGSAIIDMNGEILAQASEDKEEVIVAEADLTKTRGKQINNFNDIFLDRPEKGYGL